MSEGRDKIVDGLKDAARFAAGEDVSARVTQFLPAPPLVGRLRQYVEIAGTDQMTVIPCEDLIEAADEIERLRGLVQSLQAERDHWFRLVPDYAAAKHPFKPL